MNGGGAFEITVVDNAVVAAANCRGLRYIYVVAVPVAALQLRPGNRQNVRDTRGASRGSSYEGLAGFAAAAAWLRQHGQKTAQQPLHLVGVGVGVVGGAGALHATTHCTTMNASGGGWWESEIRVADEGG